VPNLGHKIYLYKNCLNQAIHACLIFLRHVKSFPQIPDKKFTNSVDLALHLQADKFV
jgi:hypothetical protein